MPRVAISQSGEDGHASREIGLGLGPPMTAFGNAEQGAE